MSLDVVVVNYKTPQDLREFLDSYQEFAPEQRTMLHVVNVLPGYKDRDLAYAQRGASIYNIDKQIDFGRAANIAARNGTMETIAIFNADTILTEGLLDGCADLLWSDPEYGVVGPRQVDESNRFTAAGIFGTPTHPQHRGWQEFDRGQYSNIEEAIMAAGSAFFIRRSLWTELTECPLYRQACPDAIGALMESHFFSDTWLCYHARFHGKSIIFDGSRCLVHKWHRSCEVGGYAEQTMSKFRTQFREICDVHGIEHE